MIELKGVTKNFDDFVALDNVNLDVPKGTAYGLLGSNGAGKSTILRLLSGIYKQESGEVLIDNENVYDNVAAKEKVFFINDETVQFSSYTLKELKNFYKDFYPNYSEEIFQKLNSKINLPLNKKIDKFSKGMKRQAVVIIGLSCQAEYLLLDEAFDGLDPTMRINVKNILVDSMIDRNLTIIISSHNLKEINEICDSVALLHKGKILFNRQIDDVRGNVHKIQVSFKTEMKEKDFSDLELLHFEKNGSIYHIIVKGEVDKVKEEIEKKKPLIFDIVPLSLEEIFIYEMEGLGYDCTEIK